MTESEAAPTVTGAPRREPAHPAPARADDPRYRRDLDGLRGVAIALVVVFHVWFGKVSGGVDVFLVLSGFFFTGMVLRRAGGRGGGGGGGGGRAPRRGVYRGGVGGGGG
uniref:acyltransferase family protein n=1 Tax=Nocardia brasiliensis TaxID=37326 RepID=UPI003CC7ECF4